MGKVKYFVKWNNNIVGIVYTNNQNEYTYIPNIENIQKCAKKGMPCISIIVPQKEWEKELPDFIAKNLKGEEFINSQGETELFTIISPKCRNEV